MKRILTTGNLFDPVVSAPASSDADADADAGEQVDVLVEQAGVTIERIVSTGQASPPGFWYDSPRAEWVVLLSGAATLEFEGSAQAASDEARRSRADRRALPASGGMDQRQGAERVARGLLPRRRVELNDACRAG